MYTNLATNIKQRKQQKFGNKKHKHKNFKITENKP